MLNELSQYMANKRPALARSHPSTQNIRMP
jgi:hypothetical protein